MMKADKQSPSVQSNLKKMLLMIMQMLLRMGTSWAEQGHTRDVLYVLLLDFQ